MKQSKQEILQILTDIINGKYFLPAIKVGKHEFYVVINSWHKDSGKEFQCFDKRFGTNTIPSFSVILEEFEMDAETLIIKIENKYRSTLKFL